MDVLEWAAKVSAWAKQLADYISKNNKLPDRIEPLPEPLTPSVPAPETMQQMVRRVCKEEKLTLRESNQLFATIKCESNFNPQCVHPNIDEKTGIILSTDFGIAQVNDFYHIGPKKDFPSVQYVLDNPEACIRWMARLFKSGESGKRLWVCYSKGIYKQYL